MDRLDLLRSTRGMNLTPVVVLTFIAAIASAAAGGMMYVFSTFVMRGLDRTGPVQAITAMRGINTEANANAAFLLPFFGASLLAIGVGVVAVIQWNQPGAGWLLAGAVLGVSPGRSSPWCSMCRSTIGSTRSTLTGCRLPTPPGSGRPTLSSWTAWNHVRSATGVLAAILMLAGLAQR